MNVRRYIYCLLGMMMAFCLTSCGPDEGGGFDPSALVGHWQEGTVHEKYFDNGIMAGAVKG